MSKLKTRIDKLDPPVEGGVAVYRDIDRINPLDPDDTSWIDDWRNEHPEYDGLVVHFYDYQPTCWPASGISRQVRAYVQNPSGKGRSPIIAKR